MCVMIYDVAHFATLNIRNETRKVVNTTHTDVSELTALPSFEQELEDKVF